LLAAHNDGNTVLLVGVVERQTRYFGDFLDVNAILSLILGVSLGSTDIPFRPYLMIYVQNQAHVLVREEGLHAAVVCTNMPVPYLRLKKCQTTLTIGQKRDWFT